MEVVLPVDISNGCMKRKITNKVNATERNQYSNLPSTMWISWCPVQKDNTAD